MFCISFFKFCLASFKILSIRTKGILQYCKLNGRHSKLILAFFSVLWPKTICTRVELVTYSSSESIHYLVLFIRTFANRITNRKLPWYWIDQKIRFRGFSKSVSDYWLGNLFRNQSIKPIGIVLRETISFVILLETLLCFLQTLQ